MAVAPLQIRQITPTQLQDAGQGSMSGPLTDLYNSPFQYQLYKYPMSAPNPQAPSMEHQIIFYINVPTQSYWHDEPPPGDIYQSVANRNSNATRYGLRSTDTSLIPALGATIAKAQDLILSQKSSRTTAAISLYVPPTMVYTQTLQYENVSLSDSLGVVSDAGALLNGVASGSGVTAAGALGSMLPDITQMMPGYAARRLNRAASGLNKDLEAALGIADNPQNYLLFKQIDFRHFRFDFILTPENQNEAQVINQIIYLFRFHSAPEVKSGSVGRFFVPPSSFDIDILHNGDRNVNIPRISTCVCESVNVDYAGSGAWSTTYDGQPLQIRLGLAFTEVEILTKDRIADGF